MPPAVTDLVAGHIPALITTMPSAAGVVREGRRAAFGLYRARRTRWLAPGLNRQGSRH
jgi:tripartite-type tricarboxylate transporter receptor subunit TctC